MADGGYGGTLRYVHTLFRVGAVGDLTDGELLERFTAGSREVAELAFEALVERHGPMVLRVCHTVLRDGHDAQDAFQASFFVLARKAPAIKKRDSLASWLYGVAYRVARCSRAALARRRRHEQQAAMKNEPAVSDPEPDDLSPLLHAELNRLPQALRAPVILCYLEGLTHDQAAGQLHWPVGTVRSRLARARDRLRQRLSKRRVAADEAQFCLALAAESVPRSLVDSTVRGSLGFAAKGATATVVSAPASALAQGAMKTMALSKYGVLGSATLACCVVLGGAQALAWQFGGIGGMGTRNAQAQRSAQERQDALIRSVDRIQTELAESARRNADLQKDLQALRAELEALRAGEPAAPQAPLTEGSAEKSVRRERAGAGADRGVPKAIGKAAKKAGAPEQGGQGEPAHSSLPRLMDLGQHMVVISPDGDKVALYDRQNDKAKAVRFPASKQEPLEITPILAPGIGALIISGNRVTRVAACTLTGDNTTSWYPTDLREPFHGKAMPIVGPGMVAYALGRYVYAFSARAKKWDVLELPEGVTAQPMVGPGGVTLHHDTHQYTFGIATGKWADIDFRAILEAAPENPEPDENAAKTESK